MHYYTQLYCITTLNTLLQGLEIMNPAAAEKKTNDANQKYFSATSGFLTVKPKTT